VPSVTLHDLGIEMKNDNYKYGGYGWDGENVYIADLTDLAFCINIKNKTVWTTQINLPDVSGNFRMVFANKQRDNFCMDLIARATNNTFRRYRVLYKQTEQTVEVTQIWESASDNDISYGLLKGQVISREFALIPMPNKPYIFYLDLRDGAFEKFDTGFGNYNPRIGHGVFVTKDDIILLLGKHYSGDNFKKFSVYSRSISDIPNSSPDGDSPNPANGFELHLIDKHYVCATGGTVSGSNPPLVWFDSKLELLGKTDISTVQSNPHNYGLLAIGKDSNGYILVIAVMLNNHMSNANNMKIALLRVNPDTWEIANYDILLDTSIMVECAVGSPYSSRENLPIIDTRNKKVYTIARETEYSANPKRLYIVEFDMSDVDIEEWNQNAYFVGVPRIPTTLTLTITPL